MSTDKPIPKWETITPTIAAAMLERRAVNRTIEESRVAHYAAQMRAGEWRVTHQGIALDHDDVVLDGEHRLRAIILSGVTLRMLVTRGLTAEGRMVIDTGRARSSADVAGIAGVPNSTRLSAHCSMVTAILHGASTRMSGVDVVAIYRNFTDVCDWALSSFTTSQRALTSSPVVAACMFAYPADSVAVSEFAARLQSGANMEESDPAFVLRRKLLLPAGHVSRKSENRLEIATGTLSAIASVIDGKERKAVKFTTSHLPALRDRFRDAFLASGNGRWPTTTADTIKYRNKLRRTREE